VPDLSPLVEGAGSLLGPAVKAMLKTTLGTIVLTALLAVLCVIVAARGSYLRGVIGALIAIALGLLVGVILIVKRTILSALASGVRKLSLGRRTLGALIQRMAGVKDDEAWKDRGGENVRKIERLPLAEAEARFRGAILSLTKETAEQRGFRGWVARKVQDRLLGYVETLTLARFRDESAREGGVDILRARDELSAQMDDMIVGAVDKLMMKLTAGLVLGALVLSLALSLGVRMSNLGDG